MRICRFAAMLFLFGIILASAESFAKLNGQDLIDSLSGALPKAKEDTNKVQLLHDIAYAFWNINPGEGIKYGQQAYDLATKLGWKKGQSIALEVLGTDYRFKSEFRKALDYYEQARRLYELLGNKRGVAVVSANMGQLYQSIGEFEKGLDCLLKSLAVMQELGNKPAIASITSSIGTYYFYTGNYSKALDYYFNALKLQEDMHDTVAMAIANGNIGLTYGTEKQYKRALEYFSKDLQLATKMGDKNDISRASEQMGSAYTELGEYEKALEYCYSAFRIEKEIGNRQGEAATSLIIADIYQHHKDYASAIAYCTYAMSINEETGDRQQLAGSLHDAGNAYLQLAEHGGETSDMKFNERPATDYVPVKVNIPTGKREQLSIAIQLLQRGLDTASKIHMPSVMEDCSGDLAQAYKLLGDNKRALEYYEQHMTLKDSIFSQESATKAIKADMQFSYDKKHLADSLTNAEKTKIAALSLQRQRSYTYMGAAGVLLLLTFVAVMLRNNKLLSKEKARSDGLLLNILPAQVADELKEKGTADARLYDNVSVLLADFVNFTQAGENMTPQELVDELHVCFKAFDEITTNYGIEKIKTVGDAYLATAGIPAHDAQHAKHAVQAAIEMRDFMVNRHLPEGKSFEVRIGIHSGSLVAGIVGVKKFAYDVWGDTVNTAARMEQSSEPGKINISQTTYELVKNDFSCTYRGEIEAKNKGKLQMYYVG